MGTTRSALCTFSACPHRLHCKAYSPGDGLEDLTMVGQTQNHTDSQGVTPQFPSGSRSVFPSLLLGKESITGIPRNCWEYAQMPYFLPLENMWGKVLERLLLPEQGHSYSSFRTSLSVTFPLPASSPIYYLTNQAQKAYKEPKSSQIYCPYNLQPCI